ncbi:MAG: hypothetical protein E5W34_03865, partial [Mesorhizobium sp.]
MGAGYRAAQTGDGNGIAGFAPNRRRMLPAAGILGLGLVVPLGLLTAWTVAALLGQLPEQILPPPWVVFDTLLDGIQDGSLLSST